MRKMQCIITLMLIFCLILSCDNSSAPSGVSPPDTISSAILPYEATIESASLNIYEKHGNGKQVNVYRITKNWNEETVTYNNFANHYDTSTVTSFNTTGTGWITIDISSLVRDWLTGQYPNYGLLLDQVEKSQESDFAQYHSRESEYKTPYFKIAYDLGEGNEVYIITCDISQDAYIWDVDGQRDINHGVKGRLYTGYLAGYNNDIVGEKRDLLKFEIPKEK